MTPFVNYILRIASRVPFGECKRGHALTAASTYTRPDGRRQCRECARIRGRKHDRVRDAHRTRRRIAPAIGG